MKDPEPSESFSMTQTTSFTANIPQLEPKQVSIDFLKFQRPGTAFKEEEEFLQRPDSSWGTSQKFKPGLLVKAKLGKPKQI